MLAPRRAIAGDIAVRRRGTETGRRNPFDRQVAAVVTATQTFATR
ncbi:hypothetical protein [Nocardia cyriacigeorgica]|nr:hypothetical protein [Nocardia cyriacigeorgica]